MKHRADKLLMQQGLVESREKAQALIMAGRVYHEEVKVLKSSEQYEEDTILSVRGTETTFASRGGFKLEKAINHFQADVQGLVCMDIGAATGGFTDVLLRHGAKHVYAIDVGYGQMDWTLRNHERVTVMERTNARSLTPDMLPLHPVLTVMDVSFISIKLILPVASSLMGRDGRFLTLIKPQFEAGKGQVGKNGVIRDPHTHVRVLEEICSFCPTIGLHVQGLTYSPIKGPKGNIEFLADICSNENDLIGSDQIQTLVKEAHEQLKTEG